MDYKEKYERALAKAKEQYNYPCMRSCMGILEEIFPELAESDEKIRKRLITDFGTIGKKEWGGLEVKDILAWLEKQGEHANFRKKIQVGDKVTRNEDGVLVNLSQLKRVAKPVDKIEPKFKVGDKIYLKPEYRMPDDDTPIANTVKEIRRIDDKHYRFDGAYIFIEDQDKYELVVQRPVWSDEDERLCQCLIEDQEEALNKVNNDKYGHSEIISDLKEMYHERIEWLKSLQDRVQPKQEWSEEDKNFLYDTLSNLTELKDRYGEGYGNVGRCIAWLRSLRPQNRWKPSDEQMEALDWQVENTSVGSWQYKATKELLADLKKL